MNTLGLNMIMRMGCLCSPEVVHLNSSKYYVRDRLGEGGFSTVDLVENTSTRKRYALKRITCHSAEDQKVALREIEYHKMLKHPNVIELVDSKIVGSADIVVNATSEVLLLLPYYSRGTLHDYLDVKSVTNSHLTSRDVLRIFIDICEAVRFFHDMTPEPLAHRDLKTANVCLTDDLRPVIMDLGSVAPAKVQVRGTQEAQKLQDLAAERCSMPYRAPELFTVESYCVIDQRTDIWSLGCVLYAMCYFKSPFDAVYERGDSVALAVLSGNVHYPEDTCYEQDMHDLIRYMLKANPMERPYVYSVAEKATEYLNKLENVA